MTLVLELEFLSGTSYASLGPDSDLPDWPPQPDRVFSALVASWAARGEDPAEAHALEWLERLPPPEIMATEHSPRTAPTVFVPPNDPRSHLQKRAREVLPAFRGRQPRRFPATRPHEPMVRLTWPDIDPEGPVLDALKRLANDTSYVGHSTSLTRCHFTVTQDPTKGIGAHAARKVYPGRLAELRRDFQAGRRPTPGAPVAASSRISPPIEASYFGHRWLLLEHIDGKMPDVRACAVIAKVIRDALLSGYSRIGLGDRIPSELSGHDADGNPAQGAHLAVVPLAFTGFAHADGHLMGFALVPPRESSLIGNPDFLAALRMLAPYDQKWGRRLITVAGGTAVGFSIRLAPASEPVRRSLDPQLYTAPGSLWATTTPVALDHHLKKQGAARMDEIAQQVARACRNIGLPEPVDVVVDKHSAIQGAPSARPSGRAPAWLRWHMPQTLASRQLTHAILRFEKPVAGPIILGAGRFLGLGLCRPIDQERR